MPSVDPQHAQSEQTVWVLLHGFMALNDHSETDKNPSLKEKYVCVVLAARWCRSRLDAISSLSAWQRHTVNWWLPCLSGTLSSAPYFSNINGHEAATWILSAIKSCSRRHLIFLSGKYFCFFYIQQVLWSVISFQLFRIFLFSQWSDLVFVSKWASSFQPSLMLVVFFRQSLTAS